jgi:PAS domain S-box-containing protein
VPGAAEAAAGINAVLEGRSSDFVLEYSCDSPDQARWYRMRVSPFRGRRRGVVVSHHDISEHVQSMLALQSSEKRFKALFEQAAVGVGQVDAMTGRFVQVNQRLCEITGRSTGELQQLTFSAITHPQDVAIGQEMTQKLKAGGLREFTHEKRYVRKDGSVVWANLTVSSMWAPGETPDYFMAVVQDITERKQLEEQFRQAQKLEAIGTLAGGIAHDFNNILTAIHGYTELAQMILKDNPEVREHLGAVLQATSRATGLVRQILTFSRQQRLERRPIRLQPVVAESLHLLRATIPSNIEFDISLASDSPVVLADATQIHQIIMNLGTNAGYAMKDGAGRLQVKVEKCVVDAALAARQSRLRPGAYACVSVSDTGRGMEEATLRRVFEPFFTTKPPGEGTGLGLAVVHGIMDNHDGAITVSSQPGVGTAFHLYFPAQAAESIATKSDDAPVPQGHGERILFVDDEEQLVRLGRNTLSALGYEVEVATLPAAALAMVRADPQRFALVLMDLTMPGMTGLDLASQLQRIRPALPIVLMTGYSASLTPERVEAAGITQLLLKPTSIHDLGAAVHAALSA